MKVLKSMKMMAFALFGAMSVETAFAYDDLYSSSKVPSETRQERKERKAKEKAEKAQKKDADKTNVSAMPNAGAAYRSEDMVILKSKNLKQYDFSSVNTVYVRDSTIKDDNYFLDTVQILDEQGNLEKTLILQTKEKQNVSIQNGAIVVEDPADGDGEYSSDTLFAANDDDFAYTKRLNKYHGANYNVVEEPSSSNTSTTIVYFNDWYDPYWAYGSYYWYHTPYWYHRWAWGYDYSWYGYGWHLYFHPYYYGYYPHRYYYGYYLIAITMAIVRFITLAWRTMIERYIDRERGIMEGEQTVEP